MKETLKFKKINQYFKLIIKGVIMYELVIALLVKMQTEFASHLKDKGVKVVKKTLTVEQYIKELILTLITPEQTKLSKYSTYL